MPVKSFFASTKEIIVYWSCTPLLGGSLNVQIFIDLKRSSIEWPAGPVEVCKINLVPHRQWVFSIPNKITDVVIGNMMNRRHSEFGVYCGGAIWPCNEAGLENLARYIIHASFSQEPLIYVAAQDSHDGKDKVTYASKDGNRSKTFDALDWLAQLVTHIPHKSEQMIRFMATTRKSHGACGRRRGNLLTFRAEREI
jgi:hypothetical protein